MMDTLRRRQFCRNYGIEECTKFIYRPRFNYSCSGCSHADFVEDLDCGNSAVSIKLDNLLLIIFTLDISPIISEKLIDIAGYSMHKINILYRSIMSSYRGHSIGEIDALVVRNGNPSLFTSK